METIEKIRGEVYSSNCPTRQVLDRIGDKWTTLVIGLLAEKSRRFSELRRNIGGISQKMLTQTLRNLERDGLVNREVFAEVPSRVEYSLTPLGQTLCGPLDAIREWAEENISDVLTAQTIYDELQEEKS
ncbi:MAG: helix-turn-helix transcriptional regulator [Anaerolineales bacterium]|nr:helix-turn-helix transcriptional regulator [Anaerolineales bacterium]